MSKTNKLEQIYEVNLCIDSDDEIYEINEKMEYLTQKISIEMIKLKKYSENITYKLDLNNTITFEEQELIEEQIDIFINEYYKLKQLLKQGREIRHHKETKEQDINNQKRFARNVLAHYGIK
jgi:hypothetical protein